MDRILVHNTKKVPVSRCRQINNYAFHDHRQTIRAKEEFFYSLFNRSARGAQVLHLRARALRLYLDFPQKRRGKLDKNTIIYQKKNIF